MNDSPFLVFGVSVACARRKATTLRSLGSWDEFLTLINVVSAIAILGLASARWAQIEVSEAGLGLAAIANVITSVLQYIFDPRTRAKQHETAAAAYAMQNRAIEELRSSGSIDNPAVQRVRTGLDHVGAMASSVPRLLWNRPRGLSEEIEALERKLRTDIGQN
jgi:hypothetical protein